MLWMLMTGVVVALLSPAIHRLFKERGSWILALLPAGILIYCYTYLPAILQGEVIEMTYAWVPQLGINFTFLVDGLSLFFALLIAGFGVIITLYAGGYLKNHPQLGRFYLFLILFMLSMLGVVLSGNLVAMFVFWELTSLTSYFLISFNHDKLESRTAALQALLVTVSGGLVMLVGFILLGIAGDSLVISDLLSQHDTIVNSSLYFFIIVFILVGAFTKSAQFPFHFWLPNAMAAPTPVSAYLHSATMVKAGVFLVARLMPALGGTAVWETSLMLFGGITMVLGAVLAMSYTDLKKILAYTTISSLGLLFLLLGIGTAMAIQAAIIYLLAHALYKGTLFMMAGNVDHQTGSRDISKLSGLRNVMPYTAGAGILACCSMAGLIPMLGFIGKEMLYESALHATDYSVILLTAIIFSSVLLAAVAINIGYTLFFGGYKSPQPQVKEAPWSMFTGSLLLAVAGLVLGIFPNWLVQPFIYHAAVQVENNIQVQELSLWHGFNLVLLLSIVTLLLGYVVYRFRLTIKKLVQFIIIPESSGLAVKLNRLIKRFLYVSLRITRFTQNGLLRYYIGTILWVFIGLLLYVLIAKNSPLNLRQLYDSLTDFRFYEEIICLVIVMGIIKIFYTNSRLTALASMGIAGYGLALVYIIFSAPDTAMTQFLIETLTVVLFVLVLHRLPYFETLSVKARREGYLFLSITFGAVMTYILLLVNSFPKHDELKNFFGANSVPMGHGRNIVNVILVDFRALDTLGESVVLAIAGIGIFTLLKLQSDKTSLL
jgi:multicomponent Na+:H+ antiporter subunit A